MAKYVALNGLCSTHNKPMAFQFRQEGDVYISVGSFAAIGSGAGSDAQKVSGRFVQGPDFSCKYCQNGAVYVCNNCHTPFCIKEGAERVVCPKCHTTITLQWVDDINDVDESTANTSKQ